MPHGDGSTRAHVWRSFVAAGGGGLSDVLLSREPEALFIDALVVTLWGRCIDSEELSYRKLPLSPMLGRIMVHLSRTGGMT